MNYLSTAGTETPIPARLPDCVYEGYVFHKRFRPRVHALRYSAFALWVDPLNLAQLANRNKLFSHNRFNLFSIRDRDFGSHGLSGIREELVDRLSIPGDANHLAHVRLLCYPRLFGYAFNPICVYYCYRENGELMAIVYEVNNTFGERTHYPFLFSDELDSERAKVPQDDRTNEETEAEETEADRNFLPVHGCPKEMHVSPFTPMEMQYQFKSRIPDEHLSMSIRLYDDKGTMLTASFNARQQPLSDASLLRILCLYPFMTLKVTLGIHWEALRLWLKSVPWFPHTRLAK